MPGWPRSIASLNLELSLSVKFWNYIVQKFVELYIFGFSVSKIFFGIMIEHFI